MAVSVDSVYRDYNTAGVPASGDHKPRKAEIRALLKMIQNSGGLAVTRNTLSALNGVTPPTENYMGVVLTGAGAGYYSRSGGAWVFGRGFPDTFATLVSIGGSANAITAQTEAGVNPADVLCLILPAPPGSNVAGAVTISINGGAAEPVKAAAGGNLAAGDIVGGVGTLLFRFGSEWRQLFSSATGAVFDHQGDWNGATTYTEGQITTGSNGNWYQLQNPSSLNDDPVGSATGAWLLIMAASAISDGSVEESKLAPALASRLEVAFDAIADAAAYVPVTAPNALRTNGFSSAGDGGGALYKKVGSEPAAYDGGLSLTLAGGGAPVWYARAETAITPQMLGAKGDGSTDDTAAFDLWAEAVARLRGRGLVPPLVYRIDGTVDLNGRVTQHGEKVVLFEAYGARFDARASENPFYVTNWGSLNKMVWRGGTVWQDNSAIAGAGFRLRQTGHQNIEEVVFLGGRPAGGVINSGYMAIDSYQSNPTDPDTGSFWTTIKGCMFGGNNLGGATTSNWLPYAVSIRGASNAAKVLECSFERAVRPVYIAPDASGYMPNGCLVLSSDFETCVDGVVVNGNGTGRTPGGLRVALNRVERLNAAFVNLTGTIGDVQFATLPVMRDNYIDSSVPVALHNPDNRRVNIDEMPQNTEGIVTFSAATSVAVVFPITAWGGFGSNYRAEIEVTNSNKWWVTARTSTGFTINTDVAFTGTVKWGVKRHG